MAPDGPLVLFVCQANLCRSPMAERLARAAGVRCASAGTHARPGEPMHPAAARVLTEFGADAADFRSRPVSPRLVDQADLVLTATRQQRAICVMLAPTAVRRVFTMRQFGRLAAALGPAAAPVAGDLRDALERFVAVRGTLQPVEGDEDDVGDPIGGSDAEMWTCAQTIARALRPALPLISRPPAGHPSQGGNTPEVNQHHSARDSLLG
jgi:protein-tyrosine phosphatase